MEGDNNYYEEVQLKRIHYSRSEAMVMKNCEAYCGYSTAPNDGTLAIYKNLNDLYTNFWLL